MPTYEYSCPDCGHKFELFQSITAPPVTACPQCGRNNVKRLISSGGGLLFKGSGFYLTDYKKTSTGVPGSGSSTTPPTPSSPSAPDTPTPTKPPKSPPPSKDKE